MSSTNKTEMGFNQWSLADKPTMEDFNADNALTEQLLGERYTKAEIDQKIRRADAVPTSLILNNYLYINQRGQSSYTITSDKWTYFADRWRAKTASGTATITRNPKGRWDIPTGVTVQQVVETNQSNYYKNRTAVRGSIINGKFIIEPFTITGPVFYEHTFDYAAELAYADVILGETMTQALPITTWKDQFWCQRYYHPVYAHIPGSPVLANQTSFFHATPIEMRVTPVFIGTTQLVDLNWTKKVTDYTLKIIKSYNYIRFDTIKSDGLGITTANLIPQGALDAEIYD
ncbi:hypothetical protein [Provencibacterium massiliense]|uniref:hypothetical protein n=1 Tax=Provencibacterium massiliense TaxID=1841868 RepID=UPI00117A9EBE|nr:hypothetical protein [Provencibacterium massiliense]